MSFKVKKGTIQEYQDIGAKMKKILIIGSSGLLGKSVTELLKPHYEVIEASKTSESYPIDISQIESIKGLLSKIGKVDGIVCTAGLVDFRGFDDASDQDWKYGVQNKLMGQVNLVRIGASYVNKGGTIVLTTGILSTYPMPGSSIVTTVNAAVDGFVKAASLELKEKIRVNAVSPGWITETLEYMKMDTTPGLPAKEVAKAYISLIDSNETGQIKIAAKI